MDRETRLVHAGRDPERQEGIVNPPLYRASTILYPTMAAYEGRFGRRYTSFAYGIHGTPTTIALAEAVAELSGGVRTLLLSSGLSAVTQALTAFLRRDDHLLIADTVYQPTRAFCSEILARYGEHRTLAPLPGSLATPCRSRARHGAARAGSPGDRHRRPRP